MATCKECIHYDLCYHIEHYGRLIETDEPCGDFKNKADLVEVVRCKDCRQFMEYAEGVQGIENAKGDCFIRMMCSIDRQFYGVKYDDFCSYGERRDT